MRVKKGKGVCMYACMVGVRVGKGWGVIRYWSGVGSCE